MSLLFFMKTFGFVSGYPHSEHTKCALLSSAYVHLECKNYFKFTKEISSLSHRLLLYGPTGMYTIVMIVSLLSVVTYISIGTEIYQDI
jgi:hypothetical protein